MMVQNMRQEEPEIIEVLDKCRKKLQTSPKLCGLNDSEIQICDFGNDVFCYWGIIAYQYISKINSFSYEDLVFFLGEIDEKGSVCNYIAYILQKEYGIRMIKLLIVASQCGKYQQLIPFVEDNLLFESSVELEETKAFLNVIDENKYPQMDILLSDYAKLICNMQKQEEIFRIFMIDKQEIYFKFMSCFCQKVFQIDSETGNRMLATLLQEGKNKVEKVAVDFLDIGIYYGCSIFEQYFDIIHGWMQKDKKLREKLIPIYVVYLKKAEKNDFRNDIIAELYKIPFGVASEKTAFLRAIFDRESLPEYLKPIFDNILSHPFEKDNDVLKLLFRFFSVQKKMEDAEILQSIQQVYRVNGYWNDDKNFFVQLASILHELKNNQILLVEYFFRCMFTRGIENFYFALGLYKNMVHLNDIGDILHKREISVVKLSIVLKGLLYFYYDANSICQISYKLIKIIPDTMDAEPYIAVCMDEIYENYSHTYNKLAKQYVNDNGKWVEELTKRILERYQEYIRNQKVANSKPDLQPSKERKQILRKAKLEQNTKINKTAREASFFASMFSNHVMKYGKRHAGIQYSKSDGYSYLVTPYSSRKFERELPHIYVNDPVDWYRLRRQYLKEREKYCEINN
nr:hypothetical protein [uncultured Acetatifactor sp.]